MNNKLQLLKLPYEQKIRRSRRLIRDMLKEHDMYVSKSGIDSIVLDELVQEESELMGINTPSVYVNTGSEEKSLIRYAEKYTDHTIYGDKTQKEVFTEYGYPVVSKEQSGYIEDVSNPNTSDKIKNIRMNGSRKNKFKISDKWKYLLDADFKISNKCCYYTKEYPLFKFGRDHDRYPFIGLLALESNLRKLSWKEHGCNVVSKSGVKSRPLMFWTKQDVLRFIYDNDVPIPKVYGKVVKDGDEYQTTNNIERTGCVVCPLGEHRNNGKANNFTRLKKEHPARYNYIINGGEYKNGEWIPTDEGLGMGHVLDVVGINYTEEDYYNVVYNSDRHNKFKAIAPNGDEYYHYSVKSFAYYFGLVEYDIQHVLYGEYERTKGWEFKYIDYFPEDWTVKNCNDKCYNLAKEYNNLFENNTWIECTSKFGNIYYTKNQKQLANICNLNRQNIYRCLRGGSKTHKGWKFKRIDSFKLDEAKKINNNIYKKTRN